MPEIIRTLIDRQETAEPSVLPEALKIAYGGDLHFPPSGPQRPYVIGNFVSTIDGVVSYEIPGKSGGGDISGFDESDRFIMGLLRASADAVMVGSGTLHQTSPDHLFVADSVYPAARDLYMQYRSEILNKTASPLQVVVSRSGRVDLTRAIFRTPGIRSLIVTSQAGMDLLKASGVGLLASTEVRSLGGPVIAAASVLRLLRAEFGVSLLLHEGGPSLFGRFMAEGCVDELFLTVAPQVAGRDGHPQRPGFIAGVEFRPETAPWLEIVSLKERGNHLYMRYRVT
ncbi:MAG TPA: dihydrofolate reductase family protein [Bryobacteraceae bacterium]|nr:dihydrofolate reductase family protein [Bryobacteraceae bacterium]